MGGLTDRLVTRLDRVCGPAGVITLLTAAVVVGWLGAVGIGVVLAAVPGHVAAAAPAATPQQIAAADRALTLPPTAVRIPAIGVESSLIPVGLRPDGTLDVPDVHRPEQAAWFTGAPTPGEPGPAVIVGHVNGDGRPGVFADLAKLGKGDRIEVDRADTAAVFEVTAVEQHPKSSFPTARVYRDTTAAELRLITCGGAFDPAARSYESNVIVWARLVTTA
jgi:Sortase domain